MRKHAILFLWVVLLNSRMGITGEENLFLRGDANNTDHVDLSDVLFTLDFLFLAGPVPAVSDAADANDDGEIDVGDPLATVAALFLGRALPAPGMLEPGPDPTPDDPSHGEVVMALRKATEFFHGEASDFGGYVWKYSGDLILREAEGTAGDTKIWVQPPGTPAVGEAFLDAHEATGEKIHLDAAIDAARALLRGQLRTGGWFYYIEFDPAERLEYGYRDVPVRSGQNQKTSLDDDVTQAAVRFLTRIDQILQFQDLEIHQAVEFALDSMILAQFPNGGWYQWWDRYPPEVQEYPVKPASFPESWSWIWPNDWTGVFFLNDNVMANMIATFLRAHETYVYPRYRETAEKAGDFLLLAQMPDPQPAWAQQYNSEMHPVWDRKFEPPAITGAESQTVLESLMELYRATGEKKFLGPIPRAISYFRGSLLPDGRLARFYELETNRPLYFKRIGNIYELTYNSDDLPDHYAFIVDSRLDSIEAEYLELLDSPPGGQTGESGETLTFALAEEARRVIDSLDNRGAWVEDGWVRDHDGKKVVPESGILYSQTFLKNMKILCRFLQAGG